MEANTFKRATKIKQNIKIIDEYINKFNPSKSTVWLHTSDHHGNVFGKLDLYQHEVARTGSKDAIAFKYDNFVKHYEEFLIKCTEDLMLRKEELLIEFKKL
ncbi:MAG: hypothetical protein PF569_08555 [Candidatus Woesearchaeota archaeon]|jgi:uncharacterized protein YigE (DUF2233 family)|nr:hypothetical protein [Candidatus Woesearchaeota archaeon]